MEPTMEWCGVQGAKLDLLGMTKLVCPLQGVRKASDGWVGVQIIRQATVQPLSHLFRPLALPLQALLVM